MRIPLLLLLVTIVPKLAQAQLPKLKPTTCPAADSLLGPATKEVLKAELYGSIGPGAAFGVSVGPGITDNQMSIYLHPSSPRSGILPGGYINAVLPLGSLKNLENESQPMLLVLDDSLTLPLGSPSVPTVEGHMPPTLPVKALLRPADLLSLVRARKTRVEFRGQKVTMDKVHQRGAEAALRTVMCSLASAGS